MATAIDAAARWRELLEDARWAPSPHNVQPWRLRCDADGGAALLCPPDRLLPDTDPAGLFTAVGIGCFIESLAVAAAAQDLSLTVRRTGANPGDVEPVALLALAPGGRDRLERAFLHRRRTSRLPYDGRPVDLGLLEELERIASGFGHRWTATDDRELVDWVVALNRETLFLDMADPVARGEVGRWLRFSAAEAARVATASHPLSSASRAGCSGSSSAVIDCWRSRGFGTLRTRCTAEQCEERAPSPGCGARSRPWTTGSSRDACSCACG